MDTFDGWADALQVSRLIPDGKISRNTGIEVLPFLVQAMSLTGPARLLEACRYFSAATSATRRRPQALISNVDG